MAKSKYEYVREFEQNDSLLKGTFIVIRIDGQGFHKFTDKHNFEKPNDDRGINLMNKAAFEIMNDNSEIFFAYGQSDEYSFVYKYDTTQYERRASKLVSTITSKFTSNYVYYWNEYFPTTPLLSPPSFDGRAICYPSIKALKDYLSWRQVDCHINNLYNYCFWKLVQEGNTRQRAQDILSGTVSSEKNELLFTRFNINYNELPQMHRKGSVIFKPKFPVEKYQKIEKIDIENLLETQNNVVESNQQDIEKKKFQGDENGGEIKKLKLKSGKLTIHHIDIISNQFWKEHYYLLPDI